jgi:hypothetical protein
MPVRTKAIGGDMPKRILLDQFHISVYVTRRLPRSEAEAMSRTLNGTRFRTRLRRAVRAVVRRERSLQATTVTLTG